MYNITVDVAYTYFVGEEQWLVHNECKPYKITGQLAVIWGDSRLFKNWLKNTESLARIDNLLNTDEAMQIIENARKLGIEPDFYEKGLKGLETRGNWAGIPHFKIGSTHIPIMPRLDLSIFQ